MTKEEFKNYVLSEAKKLLEQEQESISENQSKGQVLSDEKNLVDSDSIKQLAEEMKAINKKLAVNNPLISESNIVDDFIEDANARKLKTPLGREYDIELKDSLSETMLHYHSKKSLKNGKESVNETFNRLINYKKFDDKE